MERVDRERLVAFVHATRDDLGFIFDAAGPYLSPPVAERLWPAWDAVQQRGDFGALASAIKDGRYDDGLDQVGLSGPELDYKLAGLEAARDAGRNRRTPRWLRRWLKWIDVILGTLLAVIGVGEGIRELKEGVEAELVPHDEPEE